MTNGVTNEFIAVQQALAGLYSLEQELGRGGMGIVYLAHEVALDRPVALKLLPPTMAAETRMRERFLREARIAVGNVEGLTQDLDAARGVAEEVEMLLAGQQEVEDALTRK